MQVNAIKCHGFGGPLPNQRGAGTQAASALLHFRTLLASVVILCSLAACSTIPFVDAVSENQNGRVKYLVLHYTTTNFDDSLHLLTERTERPVSSHYLVPESGDPSYPGRRLRVYRLVEEDQRAWHAGRSFWRGDTDLNTRSIGIEIVNRSACEAVDPVRAMEDPEAFCEFREYDTEQIDLVIELILDILRRHPSIDPINILAHSDVAPDRKLDPGPTFPWRKLYEHGIGAWYNEDTVQRYLEHFDARPVDLLLLQKALAAYGYDVNESGELDTRTRRALRAFQLHFRPSNWTGQPDVESVAILFALLEEYRPLVLETLITHPISTVS